MRDGNRTVAEVHGGSWESIGAHFGTKGALADAGVEYYGHADWDRSDGWRENGGFEIWSLKGGVKESFEGGSWASARAFWADSRYGLPEGIMTGRASDGKDYGDWRDAPRSSAGTGEAVSRVCGAALAAEGVVDDENRLSASLSLRRRKSTGYNLYEIYTFSTDAKYLNESSAGGFRNEFVSGADAGLDLVEADALRSKNEYSRFSGAAFARDEFFFTDELSLVAGARGEAFLSRDRYRGYFGEGVDSGGKGAAGGEAALNFRPRDDVKIFARWSSFYHAPLADEMFSAYGVPNMTLKPEHGGMVEAGVDFTALEEVDFGFTAYVSRLEDEIAYFNYANVNLEDETSRAGFETSLGWYREKTGSAGILYSFTEARFASGGVKGNLVPMVPRQQLRLYGEVFTHETLAVNGGCRFVGEQRYGGDYAGRGGMMPHYAVFDVGMRFMPTWPHLDGFTFAFTVDNLFDRRYCDYGEYFDPWYVYPAAGRSVMFSVRREF
jgi:outer membrane receptor protein involved in Fe transport